MQTESITIVDNRAAYRKRLYAAYAMQPANISLIKKIMFIRFLSR